MAPRKRSTSFLLATTKLVDDELFFINHNFDAFDWDTDTATAQLELGRDGVTHLVRHTVKCDTSLLAEKHTLCTEGAFWDGPTNCAHTFSYVPLDDKMTVGAKVLAAFNDYAAHSDYHEVRHAYNYRQILKYPGYPIYGIWALDEIMATTAEYLAADARMKPIQDHTPSVNINYTIGRTFDTTAVTHAIQSAVAMALECIQATPEYPVEWRDFVKRGQFLYVRPWPNYTLDNLWRDMRTFIIHGRHIDIFDYITTSQRRDIEKLMKLRRSREHAR